MSAEQDLIDYLDAEATHEIECAQGMTELGKELRGHEVTARRLVRENAELSAERDRLQRDKDDWRENYLTLERAIVGDTGLSAITVAAQARKFRPMYEAMTAERDLMLEALGKIDHHAGLTGDSCRAIARAALKETGE